MGRFAWPLGSSRPVTRPFLPPTSLYGPGHRGVDLAGVPGEPVHAAAEGVVVFAGVVVDRPVISIDHDGGLRTTYEPVIPSVARGDRVRRGDPIGALAPGHPGCSAPACLHWGLRRDRQYLDPLLLLRPLRVRLLPLRDLLGG